MVERGLFLGNQVLHREMKKDNIARLAIYFLGITA